MALDALLSWGARLSLGALLFALPSCYTSHEPETPHTGPCYVRAWVCDGPYWAGSTPTRPRPGPCDADAQDQVGPDCRAWLVDVFTEDGLVLTGDVGYSAHRRRALLKRIDHSVSWQLENDHLVIKQVNTPSHLPMGTRRNLPLDGCSGDEYVGLGHFINDFTGFNVRFADCVDRVPELQEGIMDAFANYEDGGVVFDY